MGKTTSYAPFDLWPGNDDGRRAESMIGRIERLPLRTVWQHEALDFTRWLQQNMDVLNDVLDFTLARLDREQSVGAFNVDLIGEDEDGNPVVIENQLEKSNHDHLGKLITYMAGFEAKKAVWIVAEPRQEHIRAVTWLNSSTAASFYLVKAEAVRIENSPPAPLLTLIAGPSPETRIIAAAKTDFAERELNRYEFWQQLLTTAKERTQLHGAVSPKHKAYLPAGAGISGLTFIYIIGKSYSGVELYIDKGDAEENHAIFTRFQSEKKDIEREFGDSMDWEPLEGKRACRISKVWEDVGGWQDKEAWPQIQDRMIDAMVRLERAFRPHIKKLSRSE